MTFIESLLLDPVTTIRNYPDKQINAASHDFDRESLEERLYSLYSVLCGEVQDLDDKTFCKIGSYGDELEFLKLVNKPTSNVKIINEAWLKLKSKERNVTLEKVLAII